MVFHDGCLVFSVIYLLFFILRLCFFNSINITTQSIKIGLTSHLSKFNPKVSSFLYEDQNRLRDSIHHRSSLVMCDTDSS